MSLRLLSTILIFLVALLVACSSISVAADAEPVVLAELIAEGLEANPELLAAKDRQLSVGHRVESADDLADPVLSVAFSNYPVDSFKPDVTPMTGNEIKLAQKIPFPGKRSSKKAIAAEDELWFKGLYEESRLALIASIKTGFYKLYSTDRAIDTVKGNLALLDNLARLVETRYQVGKGKQANVLKIHLEMTRQRDRLLQLERMRVTQQGNLNRLANRPISEPIATPVALSVEPLTLDLGELQAKAESRRPLFAAWQAQIEKAKEKKQLARLDYKPDVTLWASYRFRDDDLVDKGTDFASAGFSLNLPFNRSRRADQVSAAEADLSGSYNQFAGVRSKVAFAIDDAYSSVNRNYELYQLYLTGIVPQSRQLYAATLSAYQVGKADFSDLLGSLLALDKSENELHRSASEYLQAVARLEAAAGLTNGLAVSLEK